ncbi:MAG: cytochrome C [Rhodobacteraceae bacterium]|nr:cytochrome C [Paracoccaceae bacterium]
MRTPSLLVAAFALSALALPVAAGDAEKGKTVYNKCKSCHTITDPSGQDLVKGGKVGPNLWGVVGRPVASVADFKYGDGIQKAGAKGLVWDEAMIAAYVVDPSKWLDENSGDPKAKSKMTLKLPKGGEDVAAYLATMK